MVKKIFLIFGLITLLNAALFAETIVIQLTHVLSDDTVFKLFKVREILNLKDVDFTKDKVAVVYDGSKTSEADLLASIKKEIGSDVSKFSSSSSDTKWIKPVKGEK